METNRKPGTEPNSQEGSPKDADLLLPFEQENLRGDYREYLVAKRKNHRVTLKIFPELWDCFLCLDEIFVREFFDLERISRQSLLPSHLFKGSHAKMRVALELAFSTCIYDAWNAVRSAIELAAHARNIHRDPKLGAVWLGKDKGKAESEAHKDAFERDKKKTLFHGLERLHQYYSMYSEISTHSTVSAMSLRNTFDTEDGKEKLTMHFFETDPQRLGPFLYSTLSACWLIENELFSCFRDRLDLDHHLVQMRLELEQKKARALSELIQRFNIPHPTIVP
jgi:hypothetical protein